MHQLSQIHHLLTILVHMGGGEQGDTLSRPSLRYEHLRSTVVLVYSVTDLDSYLSPYVPINPKLAHLS